MAVRRLLRRLLRDPEDEVKLAFLRTVPDLETRAFEWLTRGCVAFDLTGAAMAAAASKAKTKTRAMGERPIYGGETNLMLAFFSILQLRILVRRVTY